MTTDFKGKDAQSHVIFSSGVKAKTTWRKNVERKETREDGRLGMQPRDSFITGKCGR